MRVTYLATIEPVVLSEIGRGWRRVSSRLCCLDFIPFCDCSSSLFVLFYLNGAENVTIIWFIPIRSCVWHFAMNATASNLLVSAFFPCPLATFDLRMYNLFKIGTILGVSYTKGLTLTYSLLFEARSSQIRAGLLQYSGINGHQVDVA